MAYTLGIKFKGIRELQVEFLDIPWIPRFLTMVHRNYLYGQPIVRDFNNVDYDKFLELANRCGHVLGWDWLKTQDQLKDWSVTTKMHKDIETFLSQGYHSIPDGLDQLLHDAHHGLHSMQEAGSRSTIQLEWFNDDGFVLPDLDFVHDDTLGAVILQNPFVGHPPWWIYSQNDHSNIWQTCKFHDHVRPGLVIKMQGQMSKTIKAPNLDAYMSWWKSHAPDFVEFHGQDKLLHNSGIPVIGYVTNNHVLLELKKQNIIEFEYFRFDPTLDGLDQHNDTVKLKRSITQLDYDRMAGPDWPSYQDFVDAAEIAPWLLAEIKTMIAH